MDAKEAETSVNVPGCHGDGAVGGLSAHREVKCLRGKAEINK